MEQVKMERLLRQNLRNSYISWILDGIMCISNLWHVVDELQDESLIHLELKGNAQLLENTESPSTGKLTSDELAFIEKVCTAWKGKNTKEIVDFTHEQLPWQICYPDEEIPFVLITQEDPDHVYQPKI